MNGAKELTAEERVFASMLADAAIGYARRNLKQLKRRTNIKIIASQNTQTLFGEGRK